MRYFPKWSDACTAAGVKYDQSRERISDEDLLSDWGQVTRALAIVSPLTEYKVKGKYSRNAFNRFGKWIDVLDAFRKYAESNGEWEDMLKILDEASLKNKKKKPTLRKKARYVADSTNRRGCLTKL